MKPSPVLLTLLVREYPCKSSTSYWGGKPSLLLTPRTL